MKIEPIIRIDYDSNWKIITTNLIEDFIQFFLPNLYNDVDFSIAPEFLEQELFEMVEEEQVKNIMDKLVKLKLKSGEEKWIFVHIEFQNEVTSQSVCFCTFVVFWINMVKKLQRL